MGSAARFQQNPATRTTPWRTIGGRFGSSGDGQSGRDWDVGRPVTDERLAGEMSEKGETCP